jgi:hypothetical protein
LPTVRTTEPQQTDGIALTRAPFHAFKARPPPTAFIDEGQFLLVVGGSEPRVDQPSGPNSGASSKRDFKA